MSRTNTYLRELPPGLTHIDVYWVLRLFNVTDPCAQHAVKKLLADGSGDKGRAENMREAWETLDRWREMEGESTPVDSVHDPAPDESQEQVREGSWQHNWIEERRRLYEAMDPYFTNSCAQDDQRPPDRPLASHCPDGGACRNKCGLEPCKEASE